MSHFNSAGMCRVLQQQIQETVGLCLRKFSLYILACLKALCDNSATTLSVCA